MKTVECRSDNLPLLKALQEMCFDKVLITNYSVSKYSEEQIDWGAHTFSFHCWWKQQFLADDETYENTTISLQFWNHARSLKLSLLSKLTLLVLCLKTWKKQNNSNNWLPYHCCCSRTFTVLIHFFMSVFCVCVFQGRFTAWWSKGKCQWKSWTRFHWTMCKGLLLYTPHRLPVLTT